MGLLLAAFCATAITSAASPVRDAGASALAAGTTQAVLSFVDAASGGVEVVRHWPQAPVEVTVRPMVPYLWDGCPGAGAIMMLLTGPAAGGLAEQAAATLSSVQARELNAAASLAQIAARLRTPGDPANEAIKSAAPLVGDLETYERRGYAVFLFVRWAGARCAVIVESVPEGYGIPYVR